MSTVAEPIQAHTPTVTVTPKAVEKIRAAFQKQGVVGGLRLGVLGGGCSGLSYQFKFDPKPLATDKVMTFDDVHRRRRPRRAVPWRRIWPWRMI